MLSLIALLTCTSSLIAQVRLPVEFDTDPGWIAKPTFLPNPVASPQVVAVDGAVTLRVVEPGKGMKFELPLVPFDTGSTTYLVLRYRAENLAGGYAIWAYDGSPGGRELLNTSELICDGQWHVLALDLYARQAQGSIRSLLTEVQCRDAPAFISLDYIRLSDEVPGGATVVPAQPAESAEHIIRAADLGDLTAQPTWLAAPAGRFDAQVQDGVLHLSAEGAGKGMKFSATLAEPIDLSQYHFAVVRYRARGIEPWGDYLFWLGSEGGGMPQKSEHVMWLHQAQATDQWQVVVLPLKEAFIATNAAVQVCSSGERGELWLDYVRLCARRPLLDIADLLPVAAGWEAARLPAGSFRTVDLRPSANSRARSRVRGLGLKSWFPAGHITVRGIPFDIIAAEPDVLASPDSIDELASIPVGAAGTEAYLLLASRLPATDAERMGDPVPMERFTTPERFLVRVEYADGLTDEMFPVCVGTNRYEIRAGTEVYCLPALRPQAIRSLSLRNRMESARFLVAAVTLNQGAPVTSAPPVLGLPTPVAARDDKPGRGRITPTADGFVVENDLLRLDLKTTGGISVRSLQNRCLQHTDMHVVPGPLFEIGIRKPDDPNANQAFLTSEKVTAGVPTVVAEGDTMVLTVPVDGRPGGVPLVGQLIVKAGEGPQLAMSLALRNAATDAVTPVVSFPLVGGMKLGTVENTWYLWCRKGGVISNQPTDMWGAYGGEYPLQVADVFSPQGGAGLALLTYDTRNIPRYWHILKNTEGVTWRIDYLQREYGSGEEIETAPVGLVAHSGDWRRALALYRDWTHTWYRPHVPRKQWFQDVFYYQQVFAWSQLWDPGHKTWHMADLVRRYKDYFGCLDYLHIFDFGESRVFGRVGDYNHYEELGGLDVMRGAIKQAQDMGVPVGLYIEGYLCDIRCAWGKDNVLKHCIRNRDGSPMLWDTGSPEHVMCGASAGWRDHLASCYRRAAEDLRPNGLYIDEYGFLGGWRTCWSREHGHPVPWPPNRGEQETTRAIRDAVPADIATLTEETPNDVATQFQDGALGYSVTFNDPSLAPHRIDLIRFMFPDFKVFQLTSYNRFIEGGWQLLKYPFFNGEGYWLHGGTSDFYCEDAHHFLKQAFRILNEYADCFRSQDVEPLVPTLAPTIYANRFSAGRRTVWTLLNADFRSFRGDALRVPHLEGTRYSEAFTGAAIGARVTEGMATLPLELGPKAVGCIVAER